MADGVDSGIIRSRDNSQLRLARALQSRKAREETGLAVLEGVRLVEDAIMAGVRPEVVLFSDSVRQRPAGERLLASCPGSALRVLEVDSKVFASVSDTETSQGIVAIVKMQSAKQQTIIDKTRDCSGFTLVLENVQDPGNVGTIIRSAAAFGASGVITGQGTADPWSPKCLRASMGGVFRVPVAQADDWVVCLRALADAGTLLVADTDDRALPPWQKPLTGTVFFLLSNEGAGPSRDSLDAAHGIVRIPMPGSAESLNVAMSAAILLYEIIRQRA